MNPKFTEVTLNTVNFVRDIFYTNLARKFGIIEITRGVVPIYYTLCNFVSEIM